MTFRWLHISDIHYHYSAYNSIRLREEFLKKIKKENEKSSIDYIFITGDLADKNGKIDDGLVNYLNSICQAVSVIKSNVFIVPGNHDHDRNISKSVLDEIYKYYDSPSKEKNTYEETNRAIDNLDDASKKLLINSFSDYSEICSEFYDCEEQVLENTVTYFKSENINIACINTSIYDRSSNDDKRELHVGIKGLHQTLASYQLSEEAINIAIGHHPSSIFSEEEQKSFLDCLKTNNIHLYLCGHKHRPNYIYHHNEDIYEIITSYGNSDEYSNGGFSIGAFDTERNQYFVDFYQWKKENQWVIDTSVDNCSECGRCYFEGKKFKHVKAQNIVASLKLYGPKLSKKDISDIFGESIEIIDYPFDEIDVGAVDWNEQINATEKYVDSLKNISNKDINIFPLAPIPLLISAGYFLQNNSKCYIYQYDRDNNKWVNNGNGKISNYNISWIRKKRFFKSNRLVLKLETSSEIHSSQIKTHWNDDILCLSLYEKTLGQPLYSNHYKKMLGELFRIVDPIVSKYDEIHIYAAVPAGMAIEIGRHIQKGVYPKVHLYNFQNGYTKTNTINDLNTCS